MVGRLAFAVPGDLATPTGGYAYDRRMIHELRRLGWAVAVIDLGGGFPHADKTQRERAHDLLMAVSKRRPIVIDGLAYGVLPEMAWQLCEAHPLIALVHHPLALEFGLTAEQAEALRDSEHRALAAAHAVVVPSKAIAQLLTDAYAVPADRITVAVPGTDPAEPAPGSNDGIVHLLAVGSLIPRKGYDVLLAALAKLADLPWRVTIAGDRSSDPRMAAQLDAAIAAARLADRVTLLGAVPPEQVSSLYRRADVFVLASRFEGYGMAYAEAIAHGLPVVGTTAGAIPEAVPPEAGVLVAPEDDDALAQALHRLIANGEERRHRAAAARAAAARLPRWEESALRFSRAIEAVA